MNIFGIGVDIVELNRIKSIYSKYGDKFAKKILSPSELRSFNLSKNKCLEISQTILMIIIFLNI